MKRHDDTSNSTSPNSVQPPLSTPLSTQITFGDCAYRAIQKHFKKSTKYKAEVLLDQDPEPLHQMRVGMRRLRTALQVFGPAIAIPATMGIRKITKIAKDLGRVRDLDVLYLWFQQYAQQTVLTAGEAQELQQLLRRLLERRQHQFFCMKKLLKGQRYREVVHAYKAWLEQPLYTDLAAVPMTLLLPDLLGPLMSDLFLHPGWLVATHIQAGQIQPLALPDGAALDQGLAAWGDRVHDLRKHMKRVRYQTEFFMDFYGEAFRRQAQTFRLLQDLLGLLQDDAILEAFLLEDLGTDWQQRIPSLAQFLAQERWQLWQQWQTHQYKFLQPEFRAEVRAVIAQPCLATALTAR